MKLLRGPGILIAVLLAALLPLEQAHCLWMGVPARTSATATMSPDHRCCSRSAPAVPRNDDKAECSCIQLPAGTLPPSVVVSSAPSSTPLASNEATAAPEPRALLVAPVPALDVGSPPLLADPGAHGLRAPPASL